MSLISGIFRICIQGAEGLSHRSWNLFVNWTKPWKRGCFVYTGGARLSFSGDGGPASCRRTVWNLVDVGIPVLVVDTGEGRRRRQLHVVLAEPRTGFPRWRQVVDHLTDYRSAGPGLHTLRQTADHARLSALRFDDDAEANRYINMQHFFLCALP